MQKLHRLIHILFPKECLKQQLSTSWSDNTLRCPLCGKMMAYVVSIENRYQMVFSHTYEGDQDALETIIASAPEKFFQPVEKEEDDLSIDWELIREPIEPLLSDTWDDDESYKKCVQNYIESQREQEQQTNSIEENAIDE